MYYMLMSQPSSLLLSANDLPSDLPKEVDGKPIHYRWLTAAQVGRYIDPKSKVPIEIDDKRLRHWEREANRAVEQKVELVVCKDHDYKKSDATLGFMHGAKVVIEDGKQKLKTLLGFIGDESLSIAQKNKISLGVDDWQDAFGNEYKDAIYHVGVTGRPVLHGATGFLASSDGGDQPKVFIPSVAEDTPMPVKLSSQTRSKMATLLGIAVAAVPEQVDEASLIDQVVEKATHLSMNPSAPNKPEVNPRLVKINYRDYESQVAAMVREGQLSKASGELLLSMIQEDGKPSGTLLSVDDPDTTPMISFTKVLEVVKKLKDGKPNGERTKPQGTLLSRDLPPDHPEEENPEKQMEALGDQQAKAYREDRLRQLGHKV